VKAQRFLELLYFGKCYRFALHRRCGVLAHVSKIETRKKVEKLGKFKFLSLICAALKELPPKLSEDVARYLYELHVRDVKWVPLALQPENFKLKIKLP
jgi:hypothetical protein